MATGLQAEPVWQAPGPLTGDGNYETTRYLCAAAYTDGTFRETVLAQDRDSVRARPLEIGIDAELVVAHCKRAQRSKFLRDLLISGLSLLSLILIIALAANSPGSIVGLPLLIWLVATVIVAVEAFRIDRIRRHELSRSEFHDCNPDSAEADEGNVIVYSGFSPFVGAGFDVGGWSFAVDLQRGKQGVAAHEPRPFNLAELYDHVSQVFDLLQIPNLRLSRKLFISGRCVRGTQILPDPHRRPVGALPDGAVANYAENSSKEIRHYLCVESVAWGGELAVTLFIRFQKLSSKLFVELSAFMLPPLKASYYDLDKLHSSRPLGETITTIVAATLKAPFLLILSPFLLLGRLQTNLARGGQRRRQHDEIDKDLLFDYGASKSMRELASGEEWRVYFQKLDKEMYDKILQQQLLDCLVDFLDDHGVDTSEIKERTTHILNNGVIVSGGSINAQGLAVGEGARTKVVNATKRAREKVGA